MKHALLCAVAFLSACATAPGQPAPGPLVGAWELQEYVDTPEGGAPVYAFGNPPRGLFVFTADGHVSISIMRNPPAHTEQTVDPDPDACFPGWYCSYFGTYTIDPSGLSWVTHVTGGNIPNYLDTDQKREFTLKGDTLTIAETYDDESGVTYHAKRILRRVER